MRKVPNQFPYLGISIPLPDYFKEVLVRGKVQLSYEERERVSRDIPLIDDLPMEGGSNNHKKDGHNKLDRIHKGWETQTYQSLRLLVNLDSALSEAAVSGESSTS